MVVPMPNYKALALSLTLIDWRFLLGTGCLFRIHSTGDYANPR